MKVLRGTRAIYLTLLALVLHLPSSALAQSTPDVPDQYKRFFFQFADRRSLYEKALNSIFRATSVPVGRSYALIAGVAQYPNFPAIDRFLKPGEVDIEKLELYLRDQEFFDEIVVLKDGDMTLNNLNYFLEAYFPSRLNVSPHARFLFAYSGHGYAEGSAETVRGFLLTSAATSRADRVNRIDLEVVRTLLGPVIDSAEKVLVLINSCHSGVFLGRKPFGPNSGSGPFFPGDRGAHAIMASRANESSFHLDNVGPGSVFFEKIFAALEGVADTAPRDGVVTYRELFTYLHSEIPYVTNFSQNPVEGDISRNGSVGEFFFFNRSRQVELGNVKPWNPANAKSFGTQAGDELELGRVAFLASKFDQAEQAFRRAADADNPSGTNALGWLYQQGLGVKQDYKQARWWYQKAASAGHAGGMNNLAYLYLYGLGVNKDYEQARQWYEKAAAADDASSMSGLGYIYLYGLGAKRNYEQALWWYKKAAEAGDGNGMNGLGHLYEYGRGVKQDYKQARQWYEKAATSDNVRGMVNLGQLYEYGLGVKQDYGQARQWYEGAARKRDGKGMNNLGFLYQHGRGVNQDYVQARQWYEQAAATGDASGMNNLGFLYDNGLAVKRDYKQARQWYDKAANAGDVRAMYHLGVLYDYGRGVKRNYNQARRWYKKAAAAGDKDAKGRLRTLH